MDETNAQLNGVKLIDRLKLNRLKLFPARSARPAEGGSIKRRANQRTNEGKDRNGKRSSGRLSARRAMLSHLCDFLVLGCLGAVRLDGWTGNWMWTVHGVDG